MCLYIKPEHMNDILQPLPHITPDLFWERRELWMYRQQRVAHDVDMQWIDLPCLLNTSVLCVRTCIPVYCWLLGVYTCVCVCDDLLSRCCIQSPQVVTVGHVQRCWRLPSPTCSPLSTSLFLSADRGDFLWADVSRLFDAQWLQWCVRLSRQASFSALQQVWNNWLRFPKD